jgi:hypothetical protein
MIVYAVTRDALHIADPNYPGDINRTIYYSNGTFDPYPSGDNWDEINAGKGKNYETILYLAKSTLMPSENIARRWQEVKDGTIGNDLFPGYDIKYLNEFSGLKELLEENQVFTESSIKVGTSGHGQLKTGFFVYRDGEKLNVEDNKISLIPGNNYLGFAVYGEIEGKWKYIDFKYINVVYKKEEQLSELQIIEDNTMVVERGTGPSKFYCFENITGKVKNYGPGASDSYPRPSVIIEFYAGGEYKDSKGQSIPVLGPGEVFTFDIIPYCHTSPGSTWKLYIEDD